MTTVKTLHAIANAISSVEGFICSCSIWSQAQRPVYSMRWLILLRGNEILQFLMHKYVDNATVQLISFESAAKYHISIFVLSLTG